MQKRVIILLMLLTPVIAGAQFSDSFGDGNFSANPQWVGDVDKFIVEGGVLRLNDQAAGTAWLATESQIMDNTQWEFWVRLAFTPSNNNHPRIYLTSDQNNLGGELNGYYIRIGKDGGDNKRLFFYRQSGSTSTELLAGGTNIATGTNNQIRIRVTRDSEGNWSFFADASGSRLFVPQGSVTDNTHKSTSWFGVYCQYTVSNANRFYFDDFEVGEIIEDTLPPSVVSVSPSASNVLSVEFDEGVEQASATTVTNYLVNHGIGHPASASVDPQQANVVRLTFASAFVDNQAYEIQVSGVKDYAGNVMAGYTGNFIVYKAMAFDVVFNELMINPTPAVGLPAHEYFELYNTTTFPIYLEGWVLQHGSTRRTLPRAVIQPEGYILLVTEAAFPFFHDVGNVVAVPGLSATALTNAGTDLLLYDPSETLVSFVSYTDQWYGDPSRSNGGWSLEKIDPYNFCQGSENWRASVDPRGGTPATRNSVYSNNPDTSSPSLMRAGVENSTTVVLHFSEPMAAGALGMAAHYQLSDGPGQVVSAVPLLPDFSRVQLTLSQPMQAGQVYEVQAGPQITDCAGNQLAKRTARIALPQQVSAFDVVINEVLFNPPDQGSRYIELYNRADKVFDLKDCLITSKDTIGNFLTTIQEISGGSYLFFPGDYIVLTTNPAAVRATYMTPSPEAIIRISGMPRMTNANGILVFATKSLEEVDRFAYTEDMHFALLSTVKGVALERLNPHRPSQDPANWHSASQGAGFGTPAYQNSQYTLNVDAVSGDIEVYPEVFSPDGDGYDDVLNISYMFPDPGYVANVRIFDSRGRMVRYLTRGELLATSGILTWDGTTDDNQKAVVGIYLIHLEIFDIQGNVSNMRKTAVVGGRL